jgi:hypothetical protein
VCTELIKNGGYKSVCEIGAGRDPLFSLAEVGSLGIEYTVVDVSAEELQLLPDGYNTLEADMCDPATAELGERFDFIFSKMAAEHMRDGETVHRAVQALLLPGGEAFHFFPTLYYPIFATNRLLPEWVSDWLLNRYSPREKPKFKAYYSMCRGPSRRMLRRFTRMGFIVAEYRPFYGSQYFQRFRLLQELDDQLSAWAARRRNPHLTSFAWLRLRKPAAGEGVYRTR